MTIEELKKNCKHNDKLCIIGTASTWNKAPFNEEGCDFWGLNGLHAYTDKLGTTDKFSLWFQIHKPSRVKEQEQHFNWLKTVKFPVLMQKEFKELPTSVRYPKEEILERYRPYFESSFAWMFSLAIELGYDRIEIYGVHVSSGTEYELQRPNAEYFLGVAEGKGIEIYVPPEADILQSRVIYGYEDKDKIYNKIDHEKKTLKARRDKIQDQIQKLERINYKLEGALERDEYYKRVL